MRYDMYVVRFSYSPIDDEFPELDQLNVWSKSDSERDFLLSLYGNKKPLGGLMIPFDNLIYKIGRDRTLHFTYESMN